jgi:hypothetical protein
METTLMRRMWKIWRRRQLEGEDMVLEPGNQIIV